MAKVVALAASGFQTRELLDPIDLMRAAGVDVTIAAVGTEGLSVKSDNDVTIVADVMFRDVCHQLFDGIVVPGGMPGTINLVNNEEVCESVKAHFTNGKLVGAICGAPGYLLAEKCGILKGKKACGYLGTEGLITAAGGIAVLDRTCVDGNILTSRAPATSEAFGIELVRYLSGENAVNEVIQHALPQQA